MTGGEAYALLNGKVKSISSIVEALPKIQTPTQIAYDALTDAEKNNGTYYFIIEEGETS